MDSNKSAPSSLNLQYNISDKVKGVTRKIDQFGRIGAIPIAYRKALGLDAADSEVEVILLEGCMLIRPV